VTAEKEKVRKVLKCRREVRLSRRLAVRLFGDSASAYLEFAMSFPLLLGFSLFILEMCMFWDAAVMGNHAAFAIARIAKVHCYQSAVTDKDNPYPTVGMGSKKFSADKVVLSFFMMSSTYSWFGPKTEAATVDFYDYFKISGPLFDITCTDDPSFFQKILLAIIKAIADPIEQKMRDFINKEIGALLDKIFGGSTQQMNARFNMAMQRAVMDGTINTDLVSLKGPIKFPSDDYFSDSCESPEAAKISISYPLFKGGWLYTFFMFWKTSSDKDLDAVRVSARWTSFVEPERKLSDYFANDDGSSDLDPDDLKKRARERAKKIVDSASTEVDEWEQAVIKREQIGAQYKDPEKHQDYKDAVTKESNLWGDIVSKIGKFMQIIESKPKSGGLCGDKNDSAGIFCRTTDFTKCARVEFGNAMYCNKVGQKINRVASGHGLFKGYEPGPFPKPLGFPHYVDRYYVNPYHTHGWCSDQHFCD